MVDGPNTAATPSGESPENNGPTASEKFLFWACFISLIATSFGFIIRAMIIGDWATDFGLSQTQQGELFGVGLWPFAVSIVLFSLIIDKIGYGTSMVFAFACHVGSAAITIATGVFEWGYWGLYIGTFVLALGNGTIEAVVNPVVATMFPREKAKWLTILHAGWPGGLVIGGVIMMALPGSVTWEWKVALVLIPVLAYGLMMVRCYFPPNERVAAGVSYKAMLQEVGVLGALIVVALIVREVGRVFDWSTPVQLIIGAVLVGGYGYAVSWALGKPLFIFLLIVMIPLATTELGTDSWITELMGPAMEQINVNSGWVLVYTSAIMMVLRFYAGPIIGFFSPLGVLLVSCIVAIIGLVSLSGAAGAVSILVAATIYGFGKSFFWPAMLGIAAEQSPKGGALTLNTIAGVGMLGVGVVGAAFLGNVQDREIDGYLAENHPSLHSQVMDEEQESVFGTYRSLNSDLVADTQFRVNLFEARQAAAEELGDSPSQDEITAALADDPAYQVLVSSAYEHATGELAANQSFDDQVAALEEENYFIDAERYEGLADQTAILAEVDVTSKQNALSTVAILPGFMLICYIGMFIYFRSKGGYQAEKLTGHEPSEKEATMAGGVEGPVE
ncbi:MAG: MFS transporter [Phycisphaeraceae bacterium]